MVIRNWVGEDKIVAFLDKWMRERGYRRKVLSSTTSFMYIGWLRAFMFGKCLFPLNLLKRLWLLKENELEWKLEALVKNDVEALSDTKIFKRFIMITSSNQSTLDMCWVSGGKYEDMNEGEEETDEGGRNNDDADDNDGGNGMDLEEEP
ncbi:hypothetical protein LguiB_001577 [Lonicera macranthoides]